MRKVLHTELMTLLKNHDPISYAHSVRVGHAFFKVVTAFGCVNEEEVDGAYLHDVGKLFVPTLILNKPTSLTNEEWLVMKQHTKFGAEFLHMKGFSKTVCGMALLHHERFDGNGYLRKKDISLGAQILAICDAFDAITGDRPYRKGKPAQVAWEILLDSTGQFSLPLLRKVIDVANKGSLTHGKQGEISTAL